MFGSALPRLDCAGRVGRRRADPALADVGMVVAAEPATLLRPLLTARTPDRSRCGANSLARLGADLDAVIG